jgi:cyclin A
METTVLNALRFNLTAVTPNCFLRRLTTLLKMSDEQKHLSEYLSEITLQELPFLKFRPSQVAFSAVILSLHTMCKTVMTDLMERILSTWGIRIADIEPCVRAMHQTHSRIYDKSRTLQASFDKFSHTRFSRVSLLQPKSYAPLFVEG